MPNTLPVHYLLRTILKRPELAAYIKHIDFRSGALAFWYDDDESPLLHRR